MGSYGKKIINIYNKMKKDILRSIIREELHKTLAEQYTPGKEILWKGFRVKVIKDEGGPTLKVRSIKSTSTATNTVFRKDTQEIKEKLSEDVTLAKEDKNGRVYIRGIEYLIKKHPDLKPLVDSMLADTGKYNIGDLSVEDVMALNLQIQSSIQSQSKKPTTNKSKINPYDTPGHTSKGYMGSSYTGD
jgi:hypothetical protein